MNQAKDINTLIQKLVDICEKFIIDNRTPSNVVVKTPYIPLIPDNWSQNQILVLFEAQNLSGSRKGNNKFINSLNNCNQIKRLYGGIIDSERIGITPWDDGYLDFPLKVCFPQFHKSDYAVGNSVFWSISEDKKNITPINDLINKSSELWSQLLPEMNPKIIVCVGDIASKVISKSRVGNAKIVSTYFPYSQYVSFINKHFDFSKELDKFPEVNNALGILGKNLFSPLSGNKNKKIKSTLPMAISILTKLNSSL